MGAVTLDALLCQSLEPASAPPSVMVPFLGQLQDFRKSLYQLPDPSEYLLKLLSTLSTVMMPIRQFIEILETVFLIKDCMMSIPNAIMQLSPKPVFDCLKKLLKKLTQLIGYIPPLSYLRSFVDLVGVIVLMLDEIVGMILWLDMQITRYTALVAEALNTGDTALMQIAQCQASEMRMVTLNAVEVMRMVGPLLRLLLEPILSFISNPVLQAKMSQSLDLQAQLDNMADVVRDLSLDSIQPLLLVLSTLATALNLMQTMLVDIYNVVASILGKEPIAHRDPPTTVNF